MRILAILLMASVCGISCSRTIPSADDFQPETIVALAVLTFNLVDYGAQVDGGPKNTARWNSTEVYQRLNGSWKIVHSHWSYVKPVLKEGQAAEKRSLK